jgi:hypothetical protein
MSRGDRHISLTEDDFVTLISGGVVERPGVRIVLSDIGFAVMVRRLSETMFQTAERTTAAERG